MSSIKRLALLGALGTVAIACLPAASALAGSKLGLTVIWDPTQHTTTSADTIHIYSFRELMQRSGRTDAAHGDYVGSGQLSSRCGPSDARHWCTMPVQYELTTVHRCSIGAVWSHLYVRRIMTRPDGTAPWRELTHYHDAVMQDCP